jgi:hypothetical protein
MVPAIKRATSAGCETSASIPIATPPAAAILPSVSSGVEASPMKSTTTDAPAFA